MKSTYSFYAPLHKFIAMLAIFTVVCSVFPAPVALAVNNQEPQFEYRSAVQVKICHADAVDFSEGKQEVDPESILKKSGHGEHNDKGIDDKGDIIAQFDYEYRVKNSDDPWIPATYAGKNLSTIYSGGYTGAHILNNDCDLPTLPTTASVTVTKQVVNDNGGKAKVKDFSLFVGATPVESGKSAALPPGNYQVTETGAEVENYTTSFSGDCTAEGSLTVVAGESYSCTITNDDIATPILGCTDEDATNYDETATVDDDSCTFPLTVVKQFGGDTNATPNQFNFTVNGGAPIVFEVDGSNVVSVVNGTYDVVEVVASGFSTTYDSCTDIVIDGSGATCIITNTPIDQTKYGTLEIKKVVTGIDGTPDYTTFSYQLNGGVAVAFDTDGIVSFAAPVGTHTVTEPAVVGYTTTYNNCENLTITEGQTTTCTITNDYEPIVNPKAIDLSVTKVADDTTPAEGATVTYTLTVANAGPDTATNVVVSDHIPVGTTFVSANPAPVDANVNPLTWTIASLASGANTLITVVVTVDEETAGDTITNTATATATENDTDSTNDSATEDIVVETPGQLCVAEPNGGWADFFSDADQKLRKDGSAITDSARTNPSAVTGVADWVSGGSTGFFSLGFGGSITVGFDSYVPNVTGADISIHEATNGAGYPEESAMIEVSQDGELWKEIGTASNQNNLVTRVTFLDFDSTGWSWIKYVRVTDTSNVADFAGSYTSETMPDGFDLDAVDATQTVCDKPADPVKSCVATLVSGTDSDEDNRDDYTTVDELDKALAWVITPHELWLGITGAGWIWGDEVVQNTALGETQTFERTFGWQGTVTNATLTVSSDDSHSASFNGNFAGSKPSASHVSGQGVYNVTSLIQQGNNTLSIEVTNIGNNNPEWNPASLAYKLVIEGEVARDADCVVPYNDEPLYEIYGYVWHDENENDNWEGSEFDNLESLIEEDGELPLAGWTVSITNGTLNFATQTDALGRYEFNVPAGTWTITETMQTNWSQTFPNSGSHVVTVPELLTEADSEQSFFASVIDMLIPTVYAETIYPTSYGAYNFGNVFTGSVITPPTPSSSSRGGNGRRISLQETPRGEVLGASTGLGGALPTPEVLGVATSIVPVGAPNTGAGGSAPQGTTPVIIAILGPTVSLRTTRNG